MNGLVRWSTEVLADNARGCFLHSNRIAMTCAIRKQKITYRAITSAKLHVLEINFTLVTSEV